MEALTSSMCKTGQNFAVTLKIYLYGDSKKKTKNKKPEKKLVVTFQCIFINHKLIKESVKIHLI